MNKTVWKYELIKNPGVAQCLTLPKGASPLRAGFQDERLCLWFCVIPEEVKENRLFQYTATGQDVPMSATYIDSATHAGGTEWHVWEVNG